MDIKTRCKAIEAEIIALRRDIHRHPELGLKEERTTERIMEELKKLGISCKRMNPTGVLAEIRGMKGESSHCVLLRADMDALPVQEATGLEFASENAGVMHACGHDTHVAMLLGAAKVLSEIRDQFAGTVRLLFQPAEELGCGADMMIAQGAAENVDMAMSMHIFASLPNNVFMMREGPVAAATDKFTIRVRGKQCHGAAPQDGRDAIYAAAAILVQLQTMVSREFKPAEPIVVSVGTFHAGSAFNVISGEAVMEGNCRTFSQEIWEKIPAVMERIAQNTAAALGCTAEVHFDRVTKVVACDKTCCKIMDGAVRKIIDAPEQWKQAPMTLGGEDFGAFSTVVPIAWIQLGADSPYPMHSDKVVLHEEVLFRGAACYAQFAVDALEKLGEAAQ